MMNQKWHLGFVLSFILRVVYVSAQGRCTTTPLNPTNLTATVRALPIATMNVMIQCNCTNDDGTVVDLVRWYDPYGTRLFADRNDRFDASVPHFTKVDGSNTHVILVIPTFNDSYDGIYKCGNRFGESDRGPGSPYVDFILTIKVPTPTITISPSGPIQGAMVGSRQVINCTVSTVSGVETSSVMISWMGPQGIINDTRGRVFIKSVTDNSNNMYTSSLQFTYLKEGEFGDEGLYTCNVMILDTSNSNSIEIQPLTISIPTVSICVTAPNTPMVGQPLMLRCEVTTVRGISSDVDIVWNSNGTVLSRLNYTTASTINNSQVYSNYYFIVPLRTSDKGRVIQCEAIIQATPSISSTNNLTLLDFTVPKPSVSISQSVDSPNIGQNHNLTCTVTVVNGTSPSLVMVNWSGGDALSESSRVTISDQTNNGLQYTRMVTISPILSRDRGQYTCFVSIIGFDEADNSNTVTVVVSVPTPTVTISPSGPIQGAMVGSPQVINGTVSTVSGVDSSSVIISWMGPRGNIITSGSRVTISPTSSSGNTYTSSLQFAYLMEGDEGTYTCNVMILDASEAQSVELQSLTIPTPTVSVTAPENQTVGQSLRLECNGTIVRGVSRVEFAWRHDGTVVKSSNRVTAATTTMNNLLVYRDSYTIPQLITSHEGVRYECRLIVHGSSGVSSDDTVTLDVTGESFTVKMKHFLHNLNNSVDFSILIVYHEP